MASPILDVVIGLVGFWFMMETAKGLEVSPSTALSVAWGGVLGISAAVGLDRVTRCREARRDLTVRQAEAAAALAARRRSADPFAVQQVLITDGRDTMTVGTWTQLVATAYDSTGAVIVDKMFAWSSSNDTIASVTTTGLVRALEPGTAVITANAGNVIGTASVVVVPAH
jgi:alpha-amylase